VSYKQKLKLLLEWAEQDQTRKTIEKALRAADKEK